MQWDLSTGREQDTARRYYFKFKCKYLWSGTLLSIKINVFENFNAVFVQVVELDKTIRSSLVTDDSSTTGTYRIITNRPSRVDHVVQKVMTELKRTLIHDDTANSGLNITIYVSEPRCFLSWSSSNFNVFKLEDQDFEE